MFWYYLLLSFVGAISCEHGYNCFEESNDRIWIIKQQNSNFTCAKQCRQSSFTDCDPDRQIVSLKNLTKIAIHLAFYCNQSRSYIGKQMMISNSTCYFPKNKTETYPCHQRNINVRLLCACTRPPLIQRFGLVGASCAVNNGGCDPRTTCQDLVNETLCGPCPVGFSGNGSIGCTDIDECAIGTPCGPDLTCTNNNLTDANITSSSCICSGVECVYVTNTTTINGSQGQYTCSHYGTYTTSTWNATFCDSYSQTNGTFNITLQSQIQSTNMGCFTTVAWELRNSLGNAIYRSERTRSRTDPDRLKYVLANCVTDNGCTQVINCGNNSQCYILNDTCFFPNGTMIQYDTTTLSNNCTFTPNQLSVVRCDFVNGSECYVINDVYFFYMNGKYVCENVGVDGCDFYRNKQESTFVLPSPLPPSRVGSQCEDTFTWILSNGTNSLMVNVSDPRTGPPTLISSACFEAYQCGNCSSGYQKTSFNVCTDINECATNNGGCNLNQFCQNVNGSVTCGSCLLGFFGPFCIQNMSFATLRVSIFNSHTGVLLTGTTPPGKIILVNGTSESFVENGPTRGIFTTIYGQTVFNMLPGSYTMMSYRDVAPLDFDGIGRQNIVIDAGLDSYFVLYYVPTSALVLAVQRVIVLTWTPQDSNTVNVDLDLTFAKYNPTDYTCAAACCLADASSGLCGTIRIMSGSNTSNNLEEGYFQDAERVSATGPTIYYSYLMYVHVGSLTNPTQLKISNAQINIFSQFEQNPAVSYFLTAATPQTLPITSYWVVACIQVSPTKVITYKNLQNSTYSTFSFTQPQAINYC